MMKGNVLWMMWEFARSSSTTTSTTQRRYTFLIMAIFLLLIIALPVCNGFDVSRGQHPSRTRPSVPVFILHASSSSSSSSSNNNSDSETTGHQDPVLRLPLMEAELATLLEENRNSDNDNMQRRQKELEEAIGHAKTAAEFGVRKAQLEFYDAFSKGDMAAMERVWSTRSHVRCVHPGMVSLEGRDKVLASWRQIFLSGDDSSSSSSSSSSFEIEPTRSRVEVHGLIAICSCVEKTQGGGSLEALNVYRREEGTWKMTLHMASPTVVSIRGAGGGSPFF
jgi:SnoaL-like domain